MELFMAGMALAAALGCAVVGVRMLLSERRANGTKKGQTTEQAREERSEAEEDLYRQLNNLLRYDGSARGQVKKEGK